MWLGLFDSGITLLHSNKPYEYGKAKEYVDNLQFFNIKRAKANEAGLVDNHVFDMLWSADDEMFITTSGGLSGLELWAEFPY